MNLGCNTVLFGMTTLPEAIQHVMWAGFEGIELAALPGMADHIDPDRDLADAKIFAESIRAAGLKPVAIEAGGAPDRQTRCFMLAAAMDIPTVCVGSGGKPDDIASWHETIKRLAALAASAESAGVTVAVKPHVGAAVYSTNTALRAAQELRSRSYGINWDPSHLYRNNENLERSLDTLLPHVRHVHFRDCLSREQRVGPPETQIPGRGSIDLAALLHILHAGNYAGFLDLEIIGAKDYPLSRAMGIAAESRGFLHRCVQELG
jgi:sugar phosphate isomerase/epimerase